MSRSQAAEAVAADGVLAGQVAGVVSGLELRVMHRVPAAGAPPAAGVLVWQVLFDDTPPDVCGPSDLSAAARAAYERQHCVSQALVNADTGEVLEAAQRCSG